MDISSATNCWSLLNTLLNPVKRKIILFQKNWLIK